MVTTVKYITVQIYIYYCAEVSMVYFNPTSLF